MSNPTRIGIALLLFAGCASPNTQPGYTGYPGDLAIAGDGGGARDSSTGARDLSSSSPIDMAQAPQSDLALIPDLATPPDLVPPGKAPGEACNANADCASGKCLDVFQGAKYCVSSCTSQADCIGYMNLFCEATMPGAKTGLCVPRSPAHCASCAQDADCGTLSERCIAGPGDTAPACHVDCALAGADACPMDYACTSVQDGNVTRQLCVPKPVAGQPVACLDALGGYCDRIATPQDCARTNAAGVCTGQRVCIVQSKRFDKCGALAPQYKADCNQQDPAGCKEAYAPGVLSTIQNCGACGNACPGQTNTSDALCTNGKCDMTCRGDNYDVDKSAADGCEVADEVPPGHSQQTAAFLGNTTCSDTTSMNTFSAHVPSDARVHTNPTVTSFSGVVGAAPDWWSVFSAGGLCIDDYAVTFTTSGGGNTQCYTLTIQTNIKSQSVTVSGNGSGMMSSGSGSYSDNSTIYFKVEKSCSLPVQESVKYTVSYHL